MRSMSCDKTFDVVVAVVERASFRIGKVVVQGREAVGVENEHP